MSLSHRRRCVAVVLAPALLLFTGCMIGPDYKPPAVAVSDNWLESGDRRVNTGSATYRNWWTTFNDPVLDRLVERAYRDNLSLRQAGGRGLPGRAPLGGAPRRLFPPIPRSAGPPRSLPPAASAPPG